MTLFVDGWMEGLWRVEDGKPDRRLDAPQAHKAEQSELDEELDRVDRPASCALTPRNISDGSAPAGGAAASRAATAATPAVDVRSTSAPSRTDGTGGGEGGDLVVGQPALGADHDDDPTGGRHGDARRAARRLLVQDDGQVGRARPARRRRRCEASSATSGNHARRACLAASRAVERQRARDFAARSPFQTATLRAAAHGTIRGDADLGQHLDGELAAVALGQRLDHHERGSGAGSRRRPRHRHLEDPLAGRRDLTGDRRAAPVGEHDRLPHPQPAYGDGVVGLVTLRSPRADARPPSSDGTRWTGSDIGRSVLVERVAEPAEDRLAAGRTWPAAAPRRGSRRARAAAPPGARRAGSGSPRRW